MSPSPFCLPGENWDVESGVLVVGFADFLFLSLHVVALSRGS